LFQNFPITSLPPQLQSELNLVPVPMEVKFLPDVSRPWRRHTGVASAPPVPVSMELRFLEGPSEITGKRRLPSTLTSFVVHILVFAVALLIPLLYTESIVLSQVTQTWLVAPPPPPPPPPLPSVGRPALSRRVTRVRVDVTATVSLPTLTPRQVAALIDPTALDVGPPPLANGVPDSILGGVPGGPVGGVPGGVLGGIPGGPSQPIGLSKPQLPPKPIRVGAEVRPPRLLKHVQPIYPPNAKAARLEGSVRIDAVIDTTGRVVEMKVTDGHPLLAAAALAAVREWVYEPTYLNGQPVPILTEITVHFRLG
ncbi:MAG: energy transducer TonB, partial [Acidobacteria bacterium]|nr:energy transducer TonB [Acidobacteriota bacterium]